MSENNPYESDLVLGGQNPPLINAAILGGVDSIKQRLVSESTAERIHALNNSVQYGSKALSLALKSLTDESEDIQKLAKRLLRNHYGESGKESLLDHDPMSYFATFNDWNHEVYNHKVGIVDPKNNALIIEIYRNHHLYGDENDISQLENLLKDPIISELQALIVRATYYYNSDSDQRYIKNFDLEDFSEAYAISNICNFFRKHQSLFCDLKALYIGEPGYYYRGDENYGMGDDNSILQIDDLTQLLTALPNLEILHIRGDFRNVNINNHGFKHQKLKSLTIDSLDPQSAIYSLYPMDTPNLEYLELWMHDTNDTPFYSIIEPMLPILEDRILPKLKYLGLSNINGNQDTNRMVELLMKTTIIEQLAVLDLKMSRMTSRDLKSILDSPKCKKLKLLNVSRNIFLSVKREVLNRCTYKVVGCRVIDKD
jgi:hypothetical protein